MLQVEGYDFPVLAEWAYLDGDETEVDAYIPIGSNGEFNTVINGAVAYGQLPGSDPNGDKLVFAFQAAVTKWAREANKTIDEAQREELYVAGTPMSVKDTYTISLVNSYLFGLPSQGETYTSFLDDSFEGNGYEIIDPLVRIRAISNNAFVWALLVKPGDSEDNVWCFSDTGEISYFNCGDYFVLENSIAAWLGRDGSVVMTKEANIELDSAPPLEGIHGVNLYQLQ